MGVEGCLILEGMAGEVGVIGAGVAGVRTRAGLLRGSDDAGLEGGDGEHAAFATASIDDMMSSRLETFLTGSFFEFSVLESAFWLPPPPFFLGRDLGVGGVGGGGGGGVGGFCFWGLFFFLLLLPPVEPPDVLGLFFPPPFVFPKTRNQDVLLILNKYTIYLAKYLTPSFRESFIIKVQKLSRQMIEMYLMN